VLCKFIHCFVNPSEICLSNQRLVNYSKLGETIQGIDNYSELCKAIQSCKPIQRCLMLPDTIQHDVIQSIKLFRAL